MSKLGYSLIGCGTYLLLSALNVLVNGPRIERDLTARTRVALRAANVPARDVRFSGRDAMVTVLGGEDVKSRAQSLVMRVYGVRVARVIANALRAPSIVADKNGFQVTFTGEYPEGDHKSRFLAAAGVVFGTANVIDRMSTPAEIETPSFLEKMPTVLPLLGGMPERGKLELRGREVSLEGTVSDEASRLSIEQTAKQLVPAELKFINKVTVVPRATANEVPKEPVPEPTPVPSVKPSNEPTPKTSSLEEDLQDQLDASRVHFVFDSVRIVAESQPRVPELVKLLKRNPRTRIRIVGYADSKGSPDYNLKLSRRRARAVMEMLVKSGVSRRALIAEGRGATDFIGDTNTDEGQALNRRVEFRLMAG